MSSNVLHTQCRVCQSTDLTEVVNLGTQSVSDFVPQDKVSNGHQCPIILDLCGHCGLVQQRYTAPQDFLYTRHYWFRSGINEGIADALRDVVKSAIRYVELEPGDTVLDVGSNDGTLLRSYPTDLVRIGVEPASNLADEGRRGIDLLVSDFWGVGNPGCESFIESVKGKCKVITAIGMFYDTDTPNQFIVDVKRVLHPDGVFIAQLMCLKQTIEKYDVGNLAHEHLLFFSLRSLETLLERNGLSIEKVEENNVNGGSYRIYARHMEIVNRKTPFTYVGQWFEREGQMGLCNPSTYKDWTRTIGTNAAKVQRFLLLCKQQGKKVWGLGASTKGNVILQHYGIDSQLVEAIADRSPEKHGRYTIGTGIPIVNETYFHVANPDYALVLPYGLVDTFVTRYEGWLRAGGQMIVPLPIPYVLSFGQEYVLKNPL